MSLAPQHVKDQPGESPKYVGLPEAAEFYGMSQRTMRRMIAEGLLPAFRVGKRQIRIKVSDLEALADPIPTAAS